VRELVMSDLVFFAVDFLAIAAGVLVIANAFD
jgi:hypothetical protein